MVRHSSKGLGSLFPARPGQARSANWTKGGFSGSQDPFYSTKEWRAVREQAKARDKWRCTRCGVDVSANGTARVDHIMPLATHRYLGLALKNLRTLCVDCDNLVGGRQKHQLGTSGCGIDGMPIDPSHPWNKAT